MSRYSIDVSLFIDCLSIRSPKCRKGMKYEINGDLIKSLRDQIRPTNRTKSGECGWQKVSDCETIEMKTVSCIQTNGIHKHILCNGTLTKKSKLTKFKLKLKRSAEQKKKANPRRIIKYCIHRWYHITSNVNWTMEQAQKIFNVDIPIQALWLQKDSFALSRVPSFVSWLHQPICRFHFFIPYLFEFRWISHDQPVLNWTWN